MGEIMRDQIIDITKIQMLEIGYAGEYDLRTVKIDLKPFQKEFGDGQAVIVFVRKMGQQPTIVPTSEEDGILTWIPGTEDLAQAGWGKMELRWYVDGGLAKSKTVSVKINTSIMAENEPPEGYHDWLETLTALDAKATQMLNEIIELSKVMTKEAEDLRGEIGDASRMMEEAVRTTGQNAAEASNSAKTAGDAAAGALGSEKKAADSEGAALRYKNAAEQAKSAAETARTGAETARTGAEIARTGAEAARSGAEAAKMEAERIKNAAKDEIQQEKTEALNEINSAANVQRITDLEKDAASTKESLTNLDGRVTTLENEPKVPAELVKQVADHERRITNLEYAGDGFLYRKEEDSTEAYSKTVPSGAMPWAKFDELGGKSVVWNQLAKFNSYTWWGVVDDCTIEALQDIDFETYPIFFKKERLKLGNVFLLVMENKTSATAQAYIDTIGYSESFTAGSGKTVSYITKPKLVSNMYIVSRGGYATVLKGEKIKINVHDLTTIFGVTETSQVTDDMIAWVEAYASEHPEYNAGEIISADVESVEVQGRNLLKLTDKWPVGWTNHDPNSDTTVTLIDKDTFKYTGVLKSAYAGTYFTNDIPAKMFKNGDIVRHYGKRDDGVMIQCGIARYKKDGSVSYGDATIDDTTDFIKPYLQITSQYYIDGMTIKPILVVNSTPTDFVPYHKESIPILQTIRDLPGFGWSSRSAYNRIFRDGDKWWYEQNVNRVHLGDLQFSYDVYREAKRYVTIAIPDMMIADGSNHLELITDMISSKYTTNGSPIGMNQSDNSIGTWSRRLYIRDDSIGDVTNINLIPQYFEGVYVYYRKETPILTDITDLVPDGFENLRVEEGGSLTFVNDSYLPVPNKESYLIKLGGVTA